MSIAAIAMLIPLGCGSNGSNSSTGGGPGTYTVDGKTYTIQASTTMQASSLTKARFTSKVNGLCKEAWPRVAENLDSFERTEGRTLSKRDRLIEAIHTPILFGLTFHIFDGIRIFGAPKGMERSVERGIVGPMRIAVETGEREQLTSLDEVVALFHQYNRNVLRYGLDACLVNEAHLPPLSPSPSG